MANFLGTIVKEIRLRSRSGTRDVPPASSPTEVLPRFLRSLQEFDRVVTTSPEQTESLAADIESMAADDRPVFESVDGGEPRGYIPCRNCGMFLHTHETDSDDGRILCYESFARLHNGSR
jgi:hypothetical protein